MPKQVDYASRRRRIAEAVCLLADEQGPEGVSMRDVAARAEVSLGAVQRCFRTKEEMLLFAVEHIGERVMERVRARLGASPAQSAATALGHAAEEVALLREDHRTEARIWLGFVARACVSASLAAPLRRSYAAFEGLLVRLVTEAAESGPGDGSAMPPHVVREARTLLALTDGLTSHVLVGHLTTEQAEDVLHAHLTGLWERLGVTTASEDAG
ncbi:HTH-type transcriptional regulator BetI [Streptomyces griseoloalbus]|uniref:HTH-type transcriptional regulator PksA n=1 Tax=Streptomyces pseudogriseolus TaxID=36817 RepID=A0ABQ2SXU5_STREZ|nr:TetR/AcrR family transcriptional regulator [Streptomyces rubiginosus]GGS43449.1 HTH-type transcriptional regulator PksA [Streptomyces rubiginosus]